MIYHISDWQEFSKTKPPSMDECEKCEGSELKNITTVIDKDGLPRISIQFTVPPAKVRNHFCEFLLDNLYYLTA